MIKRALYACAAGLGLAFALGATASATDLKFDPNVAVTSDYVFRGISQTDERPAIQGGGDFTYGVGYAGVWASNVKFAGDPTDVEVDLYGGIRPVYKGFSFDVGVIYYDYIGQPAGHPDDYFEGKVAVSHAVGKATVGAAVYYSPEFFGKTGDAVYYELNGTIPIVKRLSISGAVGHQDVSYDGDYTTWNAGGTFAINDKLGLDVRYYDTDEHGFGKIFGDRVVATLKAVF